MQTKEPLRNNMKYTYQPPLAKRSAQGSNKAHDQFAQNRAVINIITLMLTRYAHNANLKVHRGPSGPACNATLKRPEARVYTTHVACVGPGLRGG